MPELPDRFEEEAEEARRMFRLGKILGRRSIEHLIATTFDFDPKNLIEDLFDDGPVWQGFVEGLLDGSQEHVGGITTPIDMDVFDHLMGRTSRVDDGPREDATVSLNRYMLLRRGL